MSKAVISKRYADALFQLGKEKATLEKMEAELQIVKEVFESNSKLIDLLDHPRFDFDKKEQLIKQAFDGFSKDVVNTLLVLVERHNHDAIIDIVNQFATYVNEANGIAEAVVYSVRELSKEEQTELSNVFAGKLNINKLKIVNVVEPSLIGGVKIRIGNTVYDGSVIGKLERMERKIVSMNY